MNPTPATFTAARIAEVLGKSPRLIRRALASVRADSQVMVRGNLTATWRIESLPAKLQSELSAAAKARGLETPLALFAEAKPWTPEIPWREVCPEHQAEALRLQRALLPVLERHRSPILEDSELVEIGRRNYAREFGNELSPERWKYLFNRTLDRDRGAEQFHRPEIFLPGNVRRSTTPPASHATGDPAFDSLGDCIAHFRDPLAPTIDEQDALWQEAVELFNEQAGAAPKKFKRRLLDFLWLRAAFLAASPNALRVNFDRKLARVAAADGDALALLDGRHLKQGESRAEAIPQPDVDRIAWYSARNCGGRTAQAVRELGQLGAKSGLTAPTLALITAPHANKSHVPRRLFNAVHRDVKLIAPHLLGKKAVDDATAALRRDYSKLRPMDVLTADDFTMPVYFSVPDGRGWYQLTRGQVLLMIDCRSLKIVGFSIQPERNYNSLVIRTLMNRTCRKWGLPRAWHFENGIWRNARLVKGSAPREWNDGRSDAELKPGWEKLGVRFIHAKRARAKLAELVGGKLQNLMEGTLGYCGRDERRDCPELTKRNKLAVEAHRIEPHGAFLSYDAWHDELERLICKYNATPQQGEILAGKSPEEVFQSHYPHKDISHLDSTCWHLLAHWCSEREVKANGIEFRIGAEKFIYRDENSSALRLQKVLAWFDPECPDVLGVTDLKGRNPVLVRRENKVDFLASLDRDGAAGREYQAELEKVAAHNAYPKARYTILKAKFEPNFRRNLASASTFDTALQFTAQREEHKAAQTEANRTRAKATRIARESGLPAALVRNADAESVAAFANMQRIEREMEAAEQSAAPAAKPTKKIYVIKPFTPGGESK